MSLDCLCKTIGIANLGDYGSPSSPYLDIINLFHWINIMFVGLPTAVFVIFFQAEVLFDSTSAYFLQI